MEEDGDLRVHGVIPRCQTCGKFADYIAINKKNGKTMYFCENCGIVHLLQFKNDGWDVIHFK